MNSEIVDRQAVRQYLLGRLDTVDEIENKISDEIFVNEQFAELVESVEQEIIEEYEEGSLDSADRKSVEEYFLQSPERKTELRFFRLLRSRFGAESTRLTDSQVDAVHPKRQNSRSACITSEAHYFWLRALIYGQAAALIVVCAIGGIYLSRIQKQQSFLETQLTSEQARSSSLRAEMARLSPSIVGLTLAVERSRSDAHLPEVALQPSTRQISVDIALQGRVASGYHARLETAAGDGPLWSANLLPITSTSGASRLHFELPTGPFKAGAYSIVLSPQISGDKAQRYYDFRVRVTEQANN